MYKRVTAMLRLMGVYLPEVSVSLGVLTLVIAIPFSLILYKQGESPAKMFYIADTMKKYGKLEDVLLVLIPIGVSYFLAVVMFAYNVYRKTIAISPAVFVPCLLAPFAMLVVAQMFLTLDFAHVDFFSSLDPKSVTPAVENLIARQQGFERLVIDTASAATFWAIFSLFWIEFFMSVARVISDQRLKVGTI